MGGILKFKGSLLKKFPSKRLIRQNISVSTSSLCKNVLSECGSVWYLEGLLPANPEVTTASFPELYPVSLDE